LTTGDCAATESLSRSFAILNNERLALLVETCAFAGRWPAWAVYRLLMAKKRRLDVAGEFIYSDTLFVSVFEAWGDCRVMAPTGSGERPE
jgi:hypothetical protein